MAYNQALAERIKKLIQATIVFQEKKMFGGVAFLLNGNMCCGVHADEVMLRVDPEKYVGLLTRINVRKFDLTGRPMKGWLLLSSLGARNSAELKFWIKEAVGYAETLKKK